jgi:hypothetical protein
MLRTAASLPCFALAAVLAAQTAAPAPAAPVVPAAPAAPVAAAVHGRVETHAGLKVLRVWGTPAQRGRAHGLLLAREFAAVAPPEFDALFARRPALLQQARSAVKRLIEYPEDVQQELDGLWQGLVESKVELRMPDLDRTFDFTDLLIANALDVFAMMGCSGFTVWGEHVDGGGVLTARNFDWPSRGEHTQTHTIVVVHHLDNGRAVAAVTWPGYVGAVTGVSSDGLAAFLHVGLNAKARMVPEPSSWPTATAARAILAHGVAEPAVVFAAAKELLGNTSPPIGYLTHVVLPAAPASGAPVAVFETDASSCVLTEAADGFVVTNHFRTHPDRGKASKDSRDRERDLQAGIGTCLDLGDKRVSPAEAWELLQKVQRGGSHAFGTLHALVFRHEPWCFELRVATHDEKGVVAAPSSTRRHVLTRAQLFPPGETFGIEAK